MRQNIFDENVLHLERIKLQMIIHPFKKCRLFLKKLGILVFATVCSSIGDCETFYFNKQLLSSKIPNAIKALEDQGFPLSVSGRIKGTEEHWDRYKAVRDLL